jgi:hypothetical protein
MLHECDAICEMQFCLGEKNRGSGLAEDARPKGGSQFGAGSRVSGSLGKAQGGLFDAALCAPLRDDGVDGVRISSETVLVPGDVMVKAALACMIASANMSRNLRISNPFGYQF